MLTLLQDSLYVYAYVYVHVYVYEHTYAFISNHNPFMVSFQVPSYLAGVERSLGRGKNQRLALRGLRISRAMAKTPYLRGCYMD